MGKRENKINAIREHIDNVSNFTTYAYGSVPRSVAVNAIRSYGGAISPEDILGLVDTTITGNGRTGLIFTEYNIYYYNGVLTERGKYSYRDIAKNNGMIPSAIFDGTYNKQVLRELLKELAYIEGKDLTGTLDDINQSMDNAINTINEISDMVQKGFNFLDGLFGNKGE